MNPTEELKRLEAKVPWKKWGPYLSERAWGTVREDYSSNGDAWDYFPHDMARSRAYRWNEDGLAGICDDQQFLCFALALWNGNDSILKERLFGLTNGQGNHGEDVKEYYYYLDSTPTHSYMKMLYKYPHAAYPYDELLTENARRTVYDPEYELVDTGVFNDNRYFDVWVEYAKNTPEDMLIRINVTNRGTEAATCHVLPSLWFRNTWSWGYENGPRGDVNGKPKMSMAGKNGNASGAVLVEHPALGKYYLFAEEASEWLFTNNETNTKRLFGVENPTPYVKDAFHRYVVQGEHTAVNPQQVGTKACALFALNLEAGETQTIRLRLANSDQKKPFSDFDKVVENRLAEADEYYQQIQNSQLNEDEKRIQRQGFAGMLWGKQIYYYNVPQWLNGDPGQPQPPPERQNGRNHTWKNIDNFDIISMPDKWEYPWFASWDWAFHCWPISLVDPEFSKHQLRLIVDHRFSNERQIPAYEWNFGDLNPPVVVWATWRIYKIEAKQFGKKDRAFLEEMFQKLDQNFNWWYEYVDDENRNLFEGGFMGLDNISVFDRSHLPVANAHIDQSDSTAWMGLYSLTMMQMALELAETTPSYQKKAITYLKHFYKIIGAMNNRGGKDFGLWDEKDGIYYDVLHFDNGDHQVLPVRSLVGLMPLFVVEVLDEKRLSRLSDFKTKLEKIISENLHHVKKDAMANPTVLLTSGGATRRLLAAVNKDRLQSLLNYISDETEFLSPFGIRSVSKFHQDAPYTYWVDNKAYTVNYEPAESQSDLFGGNSNWRGPIWFPINFLLIESLQKFGFYYGDSLTVEFPKGSGKQMPLSEVAKELSARLIRIFTRDGKGQRPVFGGTQLFQTEPNWKDYIFFYEYFHGENGAGLGASHQTGWTGLVIKLLQQVGKKAPTTEKKVAKKKEKVSA
ncbi:glucosidase [Rapidithrix thailandica]|uniref:Glucosidase n=1 Tax=Rapidithrix thailandica TaxID=413964 RepID=A0AAW9RN20_9BACT